MLYAAAEAHPDWEVMSDRTGVGLGLIAAGQVWHALAQRLARREV